MLKAKETCLIWRRKITITLGKSHKQCKVYPEKNGVLWNSALCVFCYKISTLLELIGHKGQMRAFCNK